MRFKKKINVDNVINRENKTYNELKYEYTSDNVRLTNIIFITLLKIVYKN